ncbi:MAG: BCCT family transporter, partial [Pseudomonadota bacterium]
AAITAMATCSVVAGLDAGIKRLSELNMLLAVALLLFMFLVGPTTFLLSAFLQNTGAYLADLVDLTFRQFAYQPTEWLGSWTLFYWAWWLAWAPFVGVFIARISRGRTIREFLIGVIVVPTLFSIFWFGVFGSIGFYAVLNTDLPILDIVRNDASRVTFFVLEQFPASWLTILAVVVAAFLFLVTSVVSAAFVLGMFSSHGTLNPSRIVKLGWGVILGGLGLVMILSDNIATVKSIIALGALPFVFIVTILVICLIRALVLDPAMRRDEEKR